jgi:hypothetical protein
MKSGGKAIEKMVPLESTSSVRVRVVSNAIELPHGKIGWYSCSRLGYTLVRSTKKEWTSGDYFSYTPKAESSKVVDPTTLIRDQKTGAIIIDT